MERIYKIMAFEDGSLGEKETIELFQELIDDDSAWFLQGMYGRIASSLIRSGLCHHRRSEDENGKKNS